MQLLSKELKVGLFVIAVIAVLGFMTFKIGDYDFHQGGGYSVYIYFNNAAGLDSRTKVRVSGVEAGFIQDIALVEERVRVKVRMYNHIKLLSDASASIKMAGMLGDKFLEINPGTQTPYLKDGDTISSTTGVTDIDGLIRNLAKVSIEISKLTAHVDNVIGDEDTKQALKESIISLRDAGRNLNRVIVNNDASLKKTTESIYKLSVSLEEMVKGNKEAVNSAVANINELSSSLKAQGPDTLKNIDSAASGLRDTLSENRPALKRAVDNLDKIIEKIESGEGSAGKLIKDDRLYESVTKTSDSIYKKLSALDSFRLYLTLRGDYYTRQQEGRADFSITLRPDSSHYLILGAASDPFGYGEGIRHRSTVYTAQAGKRFTENQFFKDTVVRAGVIESSLGGGIDQYFLNDRLRVYVDAFRFGRDEDYAKNPRLRTGADYYIHRNIFISAGMDDIINSKRQSFFMGGGVTFGR
ncbi:MAG: MCE family protein [Nitrospiraceae bacterium]|nr:MCE family protein [Nitrospiraceae bacterium]